MTHKNFLTFSKRILPSLRIDSRKASCISLSRSTMSNSSNVDVSSSTSNAKRSKSPPLAAISISLVLLNSPLALDPKRITQCISCFFANEIISSITSVYIPVFAKVCIFPSSHYHNFNQRNHYIYSPTLHTLISPDIIRLVIPFNL